MKFERDENKRRSTMQKHDADFKDAGRIFEGITLTLQDNRFYYGEKKYITMWLLGNVVIVVAHTDLQRLKSKNDENIDFSEIPEIDEQQISESAARFNRMPLSKGKVRINILLDETIVAYFKTLASGRGYQTLINEALKQSMMQDDLEKTIRRVIREELNAVR